MALETATYIDGLDSANPAGSDAISTADDHLRLIKSTIKATFPNVSGAVTMTQTQLNDIPNKAPLASPALTGTPTAPTAALGTNTTQVATTAFVQAALEAVYPVGSIYINATSSTNPATLLGFGTWTAFGAGRVMVGLDGSDPLFDVAEETGGSKNATAVSHTHTYSGTSGPSGSHTHGAWSNTAALSGSSYTWGSTGSLSVGATNATANSYTDTLTQAGVQGLSTAPDHTHSISGTTDSSGSSGTNANLQPYIVVRMWKRTA